MRPATVGDRGGEGAPTKDYAKAARGNFRESPMPEARLPRMCVLKLSEKGSERGFDRRFGQYTNTKTAQKVPFRCPVRLRCRGVRDFSDSFLEEGCSRKPKARKEPGLLEIPAQYAR
jgi:hypothetical protein